MAVSTQGLQVVRVIVGVIPVYVVYVELAAVFRNKTTMLTRVFLVYSIGIIGFVVVSFIDRSTPVFTSVGALSVISDLYSGWTTNRADCSASIRIYLR